MERIQLRDAVKALKADLELEETTHATEVRSNYQTYLLSNSPKQSV